MKQERIWQNREIKRRQGGKLAKSRKIGSIFQYFIMKNLMLLIHLIGYFTTMAH